MLLHKVTGINAKAKLENWLGLNSNVGVIIRNTFSATQYNSLKLP
jgi:hypothetical protein